MTDTKGKAAVDESNARFGTAESNTRYEYRLKSGGKSSSTNCMSIAVPSSGTLQICVRTGSNSATNRNLVLTQDGKELYNEVMQESDATQITLDDGKTSKVYPVISVAVGKGTVDITYPTGSLNFYAFIFTPTATGINSTMQTKKADGVEYNLAGQRVDKNYKGIVISDGKKVIRK